MPNYLSPGVYVEEVEAGSRPIEGVGTAVAAFVGLAGRGPANTPTLVTNWNQFTSVFGDFVEGSYLAHAVYGYFLNGGGAAYVVRVGADGVMPTASAELPSAAEKGKPAFRVAALESGPAGNDLSVERRAASEDAEGAFKLVVKQGSKVVETFDNVTAGKGKTSVVTAVKEQSKTIVIEEVGGALAVPSTGSVSLAGGGAAVPARVTPEDYVGDSSDRTGFAGLEAVDEVTMLTVPDLMAVYQQGDHRSRGSPGGPAGDDRALRADGRPGRHPRPAAEPQRAAGQGVAGRQGRLRLQVRALYWPWIKVFDPPHGPGQFVPPSGHVAGVWARNDDPVASTRRPPTRSSAAPSRWSSTSPRASRTSLNPTASTASGPSRAAASASGARARCRSDPSWRYLNVRRLFNYVEESILEGTQWVVFEPNDIRLWGRVKRTINAFLLRIWRDGALFGATPEEAFYVKCDEETNPPEVSRRRPAHRARSASRR